MADHLARLATVISAGANPGMQSSPAAKHDSGAPATHGRLAGPPRRSAAASACSFAPRRPPPGEVIARSLPPVDVGQPLNLFLARDQSPANVRKLPRDVDKYFAGPGKRAHNTHRTKLNHIDAFYAFLEQQNTHEIMMRFGAVVESPVDPFNRPVHRGDFGLTIPPSQSAMKGGHLSVWRACLGSDNRAQDQSMRVIRGYDGLARRPARHRPAPSWSVGCRRRR